MKIEIDKSFIRDLKGLSYEVQKEIADFRIQLIEAPNLEAFNVKRLKGYKNAFRLRIGDYGIGYYLENDTLILSRIAKREDIYKFFP